ncbi:MAG: NAD(P)H-hydrate dehydratase, partial [Brevundimonas sp.]
MTARLDPAALAAHPLPRLPADGDKEDRGAVLVVGGQAVMAGAALLAGVAALRVGAGKLQIRADRRSAPALAVAVPEAMIVIARSTEVAPLAAAGARASALVLGPGMATGGSQRRLARRLLRQAPGAPAVVDAGALPWRHEGRRFASAAAGRTVLTPHAGEMAALLGRNKEA